MRARWQMHVRFMYLTSDLIATVRRLAVGSKLHLCTSAQVAVHSARLRAELHTLAGLCGEDSSGVQRSDVVRMDIACMVVTL